MKNKKGFVVPIVIIAVIALSLVGGVYYKNNNTKPDREISAKENTDTSINIDKKEDSVNDLAVSATKTNVEVSGKVDADIRAVADIMQKFIAAYEAGNSELLKTFYSTETLRLMNQLGGSMSVKSGSKISIGDIVRVGKNIQVETIETKNNGYQDTSTFIFILDGGVWKIDLAASVEAGMPEVNMPQSDSSGFVDLKVTEVKVYPARPIVNSKEVEIVVTIKNIGSKASELGAPAFASIIENTKYPSVQGGSLAPLGSGESVVWDFGLYAFNEVFNISDTAGKKTLKIELNKNKDIVESDYNNNVFTYSFEVFNE